MDNHKKLDYLNEKTKLLKAISHPIRLCIIKCLINSQECNVKELQKKLGKPQSTISQHLSKLKLYGVVKGERRGLEIHYTVVNAEIRQIVTYLLSDLIE